MTLVLYDEEDSEIERHDVEGWDVQRLRDALKTRGFHPHRSFFPSPALGLVSKSGLPDRATERTQPVDPSTSSASRR